MALPNLPPPLAPDDVQVLLVGGPCNGMVRRLKIRQANAGHLSCQGATYVPDPRDTNYPPKAPYPSSERWVPNWQAQAIGAGVLQKPTANVSHAWTLMLQSFAHVGVAQLRRIRSATAHLDRIAYRQRRR